MSPMVAAAKLIPGLPNTPAKNRQMVNDAMLFERPEPSMNRAKIGVIV